MINRVNNNRLKITKKELYNESKISPKSNCKIAAEKSIKSFGIPFCKNNASGKSITMIANPSFFKAIKIEENENKRRIKVLKTNYVDTLVREFIKKISE